MGRPLRLTNPSYVHIVTLRTREARLLLRPTTEVTEVIGGVVARYQERFGILLHAYIFLGNHYHLVASAPRGNLWQFEQAVNREITRRLNWRLRREGSIWARRYDDQVTVEHHDALDALIYVTLNAVRHGLVYHPRDWPGLNCYEQLRTGEARAFSFVHHAAYYKAKLTNKSAKLKEFTTYHSLILTPLPGVPAKSIKEQWLLVEPLLQKRLQQLRAEQNLNSTMLKRADYRAQNPFSRPKEVSRSPRPLCYTKNLSAKLLFREFYRTLRTIYQEISMRFRAGEFFLTFPPYTLKPPLHYSTGS